MSLPSGYKRLEYIKANGSQLINSGFVVNTSDIRLFGEFEPTALGSTPNPMFGCYDSGSSGPFFSVEFRDGYFFCARGTGVGSSLKQATVNTKYSVDFSLSGGKFSLKVDGTEIMNTTFSGSINTKNPYGIMGVYYNSGTSLYPANMKCYGLKQYSGETLVRDYIPCETETGEIGLWDDINSVFYGNAGTGTFTAGPVVDQYGNDENTLLLLHGEDLTDSSQRNAQITNNGVIASDAQSKFGGKSLYFNGTSRLQADGSIFDFGTGDFTVDFWAYKQAGNGGFYLSPSVIGGLMIGPYTGTSLGIGREAVAWDTTIDISAAQNNKWNHIAVVRKSGVISVFVNGSKVGSAANTQTYNMNGGKLAVGVQSYELYGNQHAFTGYIDEYRISNIARWTENFTPPTEPYKSKEPPTAPATLQHLLAVRLSWSAVDGATKYNVYRDDVLLTSTTEKTFIDLTAAENTEYTYAVSAVNSVGESPKTTLTVYTKSGYFLCKPIIQSATFQ